MQIQLQSEATRQLLNVVSPELDQVDRVLMEAAQVSYQPLRQVLQPILAARGKRLRPALLLLAARQNHYDTRRLIPAAAAVELLHTATLVHDDMIDRAPTRRGVPTVNHTLSDRVSVLVGDYLFAKSADLAAKTESLEVMDIFAGVLMTIADGQLQEMFSSATPELLREDYYRRIACKTASLFQASTTIGATLGGVDPATAEAMRQYGFSFGMAFQILDDILDFIGNEEELGKPVGSDLRQGTLTLPAIFLLELVTENNPLDSILAGNGHSEDDVRRAIEMVRASPALDLSLAEACTFADNAKKCLAHLPDNPYRQTMIDLADCLSQVRWTGQPSH